MQRVKRWHIGLVFLLLIVAFVATVVVMRGDSSKEKGMISHGDHSHESEADLWTCSMHPFIVVDEPGDCPVCAMDLVPKKKEETLKGPQEREIAYWRAPMNPKEVYNAPGKSAMGMELVPVYEDELVGGVVISIDPVVEQNMGVRLTEARRSALTRRVRTWGNVTFDETQTFGISPRFSGWIQKLWIHYEGQPVKKGDPLYAVYSPELIAAQQEYLNARRSHAIAKGDTQKRLLDSARRKLINYGISDSEIRRSEALGRALESVTLTSPYKGVVTSTMAVEGGFFKAGASLFTISDLSRIWAEARIYEYEVPQVTVGQRAVVELPFEKGRKLEGAVTFVAPVMQGETRDLSVRLEFENRDGLLKPGMYANVTIHTGDGRFGVVVPSEAILRSGSRSLVFVRTAPGRFTPRVVTLGLSLDTGETQVLTGIAPGDQVVTSGQFLLDSESQLKEAVSKMMESRNPEPPASPVDSSEDDSFFDDM